MNETVLDEPDGPVEPVSTEEPDPGSAADPGPREGTGRVEVADQVVEKIAGHAVTLVAHAGAAPRRVLGMSVGEARAQEAADVSAKVQEGVARVRATIAVRWPHSVQAVAEEVRRRIRDDVTSMTGVQVEHVDIDVVSMTFARPADARVE